MSSHTNSETNITINIEQLNRNYNYLDTILPILSDIYACPCQSCITSNTEKIQSIILKIKEFYYFLIDCKTFIHKNEFYLKKIKELIPKMLTFNNVIIDDIACINIQIGVSIIYVDSDTNNSEITDLQHKNTLHATFTLDKLFQYYPEMRKEFVW